MVQLTPSFDAYKCACMCFVSVVVEHIIQSNDEHHARQYSSFCLHALSISLLKEREKHSQYPHTFALTNRSHSRLFHVVTA